MDNESNNNAQTTKTPPKKDPHPILIILYISLGVAFIGLLFHLPEIISRGNISLKEVLSFSIFIPIFVLSVIGWGIYKLIQKGKK